MQTEPQSTKVTWEGPFSWPKYESENGLSPLPPIPGVYLQTFKYQDGYLIYSAGLTRKPVRQRFMQHTRFYMNGHYNVLDRSAAEQGVRKEIWHGWTYARAHRDEFEAKRSEIQTAVRNQLAGFQVFVSDMGTLGTEPYMYERCEAAVMNQLYTQPSPICDLPDRGMQLASRRKSELPVTIEVTCTSVLLGLPKLLRI